MKDALDRAGWALEVLQSHTTVKLGRGKLTVRRTQNILSLQSSPCYIRTARLSCSCDSKVHNHSSITEDAG